MDPLVARVRRTVRRYSLVPRGGRVLVALSGGADSVALLHVLREMEQGEDWRVVAVAHLNHGLRGEAADRDEAFCRTMAGGLGLRFECERIEVGAVAGERRVSIEAAGHSVRYEFLARAAVRASADLVAIGHTRDDQAETFLLRVLRGAGPRGLGGIYPRAGIFIRPLLDSSRAQVRRFVADRALPFQEDDTNRELAIPRNRVRHDVIPYLARLSPGLARVLGREAAIARDDADYLDARADEVFAQLVKESGGAVRIEAAGLCAQPPAISRRVAARAASMLAGGRPVGFEHVETLLDLARVEGGMTPTRHLPGQVATRVGAEIVLGRKSEPGRPFSAGGTNPFSFSLSIPGEAVSPLGWTVSAERAGWPPDGQSDRPSDPWPDDPLRAVLDAAALALPLRIRSWAAGDRIRPLGMSGSRKLQDLFVDRKVPRARRGEVPVVVDAENRVVWVAGHAISEDFRVTGGTGDVVILKLKYWRHGT